MYNNLKYLESLQGWVGQGGFNLDRILRVAQALDNPQDKLRSIHVAGTNGKGSTCSLISSILGSAGFKVGLTISPHLNKVNERIVVDGLAIGDEELSQLVVEVREAANSVLTELSHFEFMTLSAFLHFQKTKVDFAVIETGLGGRLDASNIISKPDICCITSIALDHQDILGDRLSTICVEKAGIIKSGSNVCIGSLGADLLKICESVAVERQEANLYAFGRDFYCQGEGNGVFVYSSNNRQLRLNSGLRGDHQASNLALAVKAAELLHIEEEYIRTGVAEVFWPGRLERFQFNNRDILLDCAHNPAGVECLVDYIYSSDFKVDVIVFGALKTKGWQEMLLKLSNLSRNWILLEPKSEMAVTRSDLARFISDHDLGNYSLEGIDKILKSDPDSQGLNNILITGSIYLIGEIRSQFGQKDRAIWKRQVNSKT